MAGEGDNVSDVYREAWERLEKRLLRFRMAQKPYSDSEQDSQVCLSIVAAAYKFDGMMRLSLEEAKKEKEMEGLFGEDREG